MEEFIKEHLYKNNFEYAPIPDIHLANIYALLHDDIHNEIENGVVLLYYGIYHFINRNYGDMVHYYLKSIAMGNVNSMHQLASYYYEFDEDSVNALKYWLLAIDHGHIDSMIVVAWHYHSDGDHDNAVKYFLMASVHGHIDGIIYLAVHYKEYNDFDNAMKYYLIGIDNKDYRCVDNAMHLCMQNNMNYLAIVSNKVLNIHLNNYIVTKIMIGTTIMKIPLTYDLLNVLINIDQTKCEPYEVIHFQTKCNPHHIFHLLP